MFTLQSYHKAFDGAFKSPDVVEERHDSVYEVQEKTNGDNYNTYGDGHDDAYYGGAIDEDYEDYEDYETYEDYDNVYGNIYKTPQNFYETQDTSYSTVAENEYDSHDATQGASAKFTASPNPRPAYHYGHQGYQHSVVSSQTNVRKPPNWVLPAITAVRFWFDAAFIVCHYAYFGPFADISKLLNLDSNSDFLFQIKLISIDEWKLIENSTPILIDSFKITQT